MGLDRFLPITLWPCEQATLGARNFQTGAATEECNTPLEKPLLGLSNELLLDSVECSVLPLGGAKHSTLLFKINFIKLLLMLQSSTWVVSAQLHMGFDNKSHASL